ncbi:hypothetical protein HPB51_006956 [Rhipicephalus microplus]|uniref:Gag-like protein n=1 Tax=Rhipicephalus microplus TaxID=6941 RepID=A0A9J6ERU2_RHIMP|nr:hypothetical protein HPB51_006956 [Rhipicephalus microplus]
MQGALVSEKTKVGEDKCKESPEGIDLNAKRPASPDYWNVSTDLRQPFSEIRPRMANQPKQQSRTKTENDDISRDIGGGKMESPRKEGEVQGLRDLRTSAILVCDKEFLDLLMVTQHEVPQASQHLRGLLDEFQKVKEIALQVVEKNAYLEGRVRELAKTKPAEIRTFVEVTRTNLANKGRDGENRSTPSERKAVLLVRAPEDEEETSSGEVRERLVRHFDSITLGLKNVVLRPIRGGVAVTTTSATAVKKLQDRIREHEQTKQFETKIVDAAEPEIRLISVDRKVDSKDISRILLEQNEIERAVEDIEVVWRTERQSGSHVTLRISNIGLAKEILQKQRVNIGWSRCRVFENVYLPKCTYCTRLGHREGKCYAKKACCTECGGNHYYKDCREEGKSCPLCVDAGKEAVDHSMWDGPCPTFEDRYQRRRRELGFA